jgi:hypothetical protein
MTEDKDITCHDACCHHWMLRVGGFCGADGMGVQE